MRKQNRIALFNILSVILLNGISLFTAPLFSRLLGNSGYGWLRIYNVWVGVIATVFTLQTAVTLVNARVEYSEEAQRKYQSSAMALSALTYLIFSAVVCIFIRPVSRLLGLTPFLVGLMLVQAFSSYCITFLSTKLTYEFKAGWNMIVSLAVTLITLVLSLVLVLNMPMETRYYGRIIATAATYGILGIPICVWILTQGRILFHGKYWKFCLALCIPAVFHNLSDLLLGQSDQVMLQRMLGEGTVGSYGLAWQLSNVMFVIFVALNRTWCPFFFDEMKQGKRDAMMAKSINFLELFTVLSVGFILLCTEVYHIYGDESFWSSTGTIPIFVASFYLNFLCTYPVNYEYYRKKTLSVAVITIFAAVLNIGLNYLLIQRMGMLGAATATALSHGVQLLLHYCYTRYFLGKGDYPFGVRIWWKYGAVFFGMMAFVYLTQELWILRWGVGACIGAWELLRIWKRKVLI